jgi:ubiquinone/menaquinone biosynthesis C-methylase UbiE
MWASFFNVEHILSELQINSDIRDLVEVGCGYGTFTIPSAKIITGNLYAYDIEAAMIDNLSLELHRRQISNVITEKRDILTGSTGLTDNCVDYVMLFNILHHESPEEFLLEANRILKPNGKIGIIHWRSDIETPRGPDLAIRPKPEQVLRWLDITGFSIYRQPVFLEPYHFGLVGLKN